MIPRSRLAGVALVFIIFATLLFHGRSSVRERFSTVTGSKATEHKPQVPEKETPVPDDRPPAASPSACTNRLEWLHEIADSIDVTFPLKYARRDIVIRPKSGLERPSLTKLNDTLLPDFQEISSADGCELGEKHRLPPFHLEVPAFSKHVEASHVLFGAATTLERLDASIPFFQRWLANTGARMIVIVTGNEDATPDQQAMEDLQRQMRDLGMLVTLVKPMRKKDTNIERFFSLIRVLNQNKDEKTKWFGFVDDDTFFTSMSALVSRLEEFDHEKRWYLGAVSEEWWTVVHYGLIAMGLYFLISFLLRYLNMLQVAVGFSSPPPWSTRLTNILTIARKPHTLVLATTESPNASTKRPTAG